MVFLDHRYDPEKPSRSRWGRNKDMGTFFQKNKFSKIFDIFQRIFYIGDEMSEYAKLTLLTAKVRENVAQQQLQKS